MQDQQVKLEGELKDKQAARAAAKPDNSEFPDIFSKPGKFLPGIFSENAKTTGGSGGSDAFEEINIDGNEEATQL